MKYFVLFAAFGCSSASFPVEEVSDAVVADSGAADAQAEVAVDAPSVDDRIDPIALGRAWTYDVEIFGTYAGCAAGTQIGKVLRAGNYQGKSAFEVQSFCPGFGASWYAVAGDVVDLYYKTWLRVVDAPVRAGHSWSNGGATITWREEGSVTTPAGTFDNCFRAEQSASSFTIFCRGVGPVRWYVKDAGGNGYDAKLTAKNF
jgi:hypothetical protein